MTGYEYFNSNKRNVVLRIRSTVSLKDGLILVATQAVVRRQKRPSSMKWSDLGPISRMLFPSYIKSDGKWELCNSIVRYNHAKKFTCHDSTAIEPCAHFRRDHVTWIRMRAEWNYHRIWIMIEKSFVKWTDSIALFLYIMTFKPIGISNMRFKRTRRRQVGNA